MGTWRAGIVSHRTHAATAVMTGKAITEISSGRARPLHDTEDTQGIVPRARTWNGLAYLYALVIGAAAGYLLMHVPFQVTDNLGNLLTLQAKSIGRVFLDTLTLQGFMRRHVW